MSEKPRICDYGDSTYRQDFWEGQGRDYEDAVERRVLKSMLPARGRRLLEIGAGFGRITNEYGMFEQVVLLDFSLEQLQYARATFGDEGYLYVAADAYRMPFRPGIFDQATMIRVIHHFENVPAVLGQIRSVLADNGKFILEYANKRNLKAILRHLFGFNQWNPYTLEPIEFVELNFNFHPDYMHTIRSRSSVSRRVPCRARVLVSPGFAEARAADAVACGCGRRAAAEQLCAVSQRVPGFAIAGPGAKREIVARE